MPLIDSIKLIKNAFEKVNQPLKVLCHHLNEIKNLPCLIVNNQHNWVHDKDRLSYALQHFYPYAQLTPQETFSCPGVVGVSSKTLKLIHKINQAKDSFKKTVLIYAKSIKNHPDKSAGKLLAKAGYGYVKLKQVYRHIHCIDYHPFKISWSKSKNARHQIINIKKANEMLIKAGRGEHIEIQLLKLNKLPFQEKLIIYKSIKPSWVANIVLDKNIKENESIRTSIPIFYLHNPKLPTPHVVFSKSSANGSRKSRNDKKVEDVPFLKSISAYRCIK